ncbi:alpha/beta fold hydrolase [Streptomyces sp. NPDC060064]|uniref:alpha/beta fold hydrolase n=1 Tax=Streptomyces sp. NPDC060064 TaxID=3347049 RepID=UPI0036A1A7FD
MVDHHTLHVGGIRLACQVSGPPEARPLVLLHALGKDSTDWDTVTPAFARDWRVHALNLRGHGRSDWPGAYSLELMRDDVLGSLDALGLATVDLIGHSMGGIVAYLLAQEHPQRVDRLVLEDVPLPRPRERTSLTRPEGELNFDWEMVVAVKAQIDTPDPAWLGWLDEVTAETLVVAGGPQSHVAQDGVAELASRIPRGRLSVVPVGHLIHEADPQAFVDLTLPFLRADSSRPKSRM